MAKVYHCDDAGVPSFTYGQSGADGFAAFKIILKACLVGGYGGKTAAGWSLVAEGDRHIVLRNGSHSGYVCFTHEAVGNMWVSIWVAETFLGMSGNFMTGDGLKSGTTASNANPQRFHLYYLVFSAANSSWYLLADAKSFVFVGAGYHSLVEVGAGNEYDFRSLYVGETTDGYFLALGGQNLLASSVDTAKSHFSHVGVTILKNPATGLLVSLGSIEVLTPSLVLSGSSNLNTSYPLGPVPVLRPAVYAGGVYAGALRGCMVSPDFSSTTPSRTAKNLGLAAGINCGAINTPLSLGDGATWYVGTTTPLTQATFLVTDKTGSW